MITVIFSNIFKLLIIFLVAYSGGLLVKYGLTRVNYTRKVNHFCLFFIPAFIDKVFVYSDSVMVWVGEAFFAFFSFIIFIKPVREAISIIGTAFSSFDRPEDRPYTLLWFFTQQVAGYLVLMPAMEIFDKYQMMNLLSIPILIGTFGDGLAEPVGVRFGKCRYMTCAIFTKRKYIRTLEGSLTVFISSILITAFFYPFFNAAQFIALIITLPITMTLVEAFAPHTWDNPLMSLIGFANIFLIKQYM
ncbi:MAG: hypothetical protein FJZ09_07080 [Candidatus Omnitrophica bacterium]|nr:hypothetical protein [Candidatus Omnitrophota bacterium]